MSTFYFAWVDADETTFLVGHERIDEQIARFRLQHLEGQIPTLSIDIRNPRIGLLNPSRKQWCWFSWFNGTDETFPLFRGRLVGIPTNILGQICTLQFIARADDFFAQKQLIAERLKVRPHYDPVFIDIAKRDDPDKILEGWSRLWHIDRTTLAWSTSDILIGEDGTENFQRWEHPYNDIELTMEQSPLIAVSIQMDVAWNQEASGVIDIGRNLFNCFTGGNIISDWPKPGASLGGGYNVLYSFAGDTHGADEVSTVQLSSNYTNNEKTHRDGDILSIEQTYTLPSGPKWNDISVKAALTNSTVTFNQVGIVDPGAVDIDGDPAPINQPAIVKTTKQMVVQWSVSTSLTLRYQTSRARRERAFISMTADVQPILIDPLVTEDTEQIVLNGANVGVPIVDLVNWTTVSDSDVEVGQLIFPDDPSVPGQTSTQICVDPGHTGDTQPIFSNVEGETTPDGTATWASLGGTPIPENAPDWQAFAPVKLGAILLPRVPIWSDLSILQVGPLIGLPQYGIDIGLGQIVRDPSGNYQVCVEAGRTKTYYPAIPPFSGSYGSTTVDGTVVWRCLGLRLPTGYNMFVSTQAGDSGAILPQFGASSFGQTVTDGSVVWTNIGGIDLPVGGYPGQTWRRAYFPTNRGLRSIEFGIARGRARLRMRSRAVNVRFQIPFERATSLSCRKNAIVFDPRLPGGQAAGKVVSYLMEGTGDRGSIRAEVTIGCSVGNGNSITEVEGEPIYAADGYVEIGYQYYVGTVHTIIGGDIGYTPPISESADDGIIFPLEKADVVLFEGTIGSLPGQTTAVMTSFATTSGQSAQLSSSALASPRFPQRSLSSTTQTIDTLSNDLTKAETILADALQNTHDALQSQAFWYELALKPLDINGSFEEDYVIQTTPVMIPMNIDLSAASSS
jgi:hypothetical protein